MTALDPAYHAEVDRVDRGSWTDVLSGFRDAGLYQTWHYGAIRWGDGNLSHLVLRRDGEAVAAAQARIAKVPLLPAGIAYVAWGPMWRRTGADDDLGALRQAIRALREEYVTRRRLLLRLRVADPEDTPGLAPILEEEGLALDTSIQRQRTILIDLRRDPEELRKGLHIKWRQNLTRSEKNDFDVECGTGLELYDAFLGLYREMVGAKGFVDFVDVDEFRELQKVLPADLKMETMVCRYEGRPVSAVVNSCIGQTALNLFAATNTVGRQKGAAYYLKWRELLRLKEKGFESYDFGGVNPEANPGVYKAKIGVVGKRDENGREITRVGEYNACEGALSASVAWSADLARQSWRRMRRAMSRAGRSHHE